MKMLFYLGIIFLFFLGCNTSKNVAVADPAKAVNDTVRIANDELQYEVIIIDPGFSTWLVTRARPRNFYSQEYMETRNRVWVSEWNSRAVQGGRNRDLFEMPINYDISIDYGYEVNYLIFNYLTYFQLANNIRLGGFMPRI
jgi:hypothetical protein